MEKNLTGLLLREDAASDPRRDAYIAILERFRAALDSAPPQHWWGRICRMLVALRDEPEQINEDIRAYVMSQIAEALRIMREHARESRASPAKDNAGRARRAEDVIHAIASIFELPPVCHDEIAVHVIRLVDIAAAVPERLRYESDATGPYLLVRIRDTSPWTRLDLPNVPNLMCKGGFARVVLKIHARSPTCLLRRELPLNDVDVIACCDRPTATREANRLGTDPSGIEWVESFDDVLALMAGRDLDLNQCFVSANALVCTEAAIRAARSGTVRVEAEDRGLYGTEVVFYESIRLAKNRGSYRLIKFVVEEKALSFRFCALNEQLPLGIYWLVLARKLAGKKNAGQLLNRMHELGRRIGQVKENERTVYDVLDAVHERYPFFRIDSVSLDEIGVARWLAGKLARMADRTFRIRFGIPNGLVLVRSDMDTVPYSADLHGYVEDPERDKRTADEWPAFLERCRARNAAYKQTA